VVTAQTKISLGEIILRLPCFETVFGTRRHNMLFMTAPCALGELVLSFLPPLTHVGLDRWGSLVVPQWFSVPLERSWVLAVLVSSFLEAVVVVRVVVLVILRPRSPVFLFVNLN